MIEHLKRLSKDSFIYGLGGAISTFVGVLLAPILTRIFTPSDYGVIELLATLTMVLTILLRFGLDSAIAVQYYEHEDQERKKLVTSTAFWFTLSASLLFVALLQPFVAQFSELIFGTRVHAGLLRIVLLALPFHIIVMSAMIMLRLRFRSIAYTVLNLTRVALSVSMVILLVVIFRLSLSGYFYASLIVQVVAAGIGIFIIRDLLVRHFSAAQLKELLRVGAPLILSGLAVWILNLVDRFFLAKLSTLEEVGLYSIGARVATVVTLIVSAFQTAWGTYSLSIVKNPEAKLTFQRTYHYYLILLCAVTTILSVFAKEILTILTTAAYLPAQWVVAPLAFSIVAYGIYHIFMIGVVQAKKTQYVTYTILTAAAINIGLNFLLIPSYGMYGAAVATLLSYLTAVVIIYRFSQSMFHIPYDIPKSVFVAITSAVFIALGTFWNAPFFPSITIKVMIMLAYALLLWRVFITPSERQFALAAGRSLWSRWRKKGGAPV